MVPLFEWQLRGTQFPESCVSKGSIAANQNSASKAENSGSAMKQHP
jgi:hypothetical protein